MTSYPIAVIVGSLRRDSFTCKLANAMAKLAPAELALRQLEIGPAALQPG